MKNLLFTNPHSGETYIGRLDPEFGDLGISLVIGLVAASDDFCPGWIVLCERFTEIPEHPFKIVRFDETGNWRDDIQEDAQQIWGYYLVDNVHFTYLCEITPNLEGRWLYNRVSDKGAQWFTEEALHDIENNNGGEGDEETHYFRPSNGEFVHNVELPDHVETWEETWEHLVNTYRSNPITK